MTEATLELPNQPVFVGAAAAFAAELAERIGFGVEDRAAILAAVDEACSFVLRRSQQESLSYRLTLRLDPRGLVITVRDQALPLDPERPAEETTTELGVKLMKALVDEVQFFNRGRDGNEVRLLKRFKGSIHGLVHRLEPVAGEVPDEIVVRAVQPEEAVGVSRCIYRAYGYTYSGVESIYSPEWVQQMTLQGDLISVVALLPEGEVVGHGALLRTQVAGLFELGLAAVVPEFRGVGLFNHITAQLVKLARARGIACLSSQPVCHHPYSQKAVRSFGFIECGLCLACIPSQEKVKGQSSARYRGSLMDFLNVLDPASPAREVYLPTGYEEILQRVLERFGQARQSGSGERGRQPGRVDSQLHPPMNRALLTIEGAAVERLPEVIRQLLAEGVAVIWAELDLADPATPENVQFLNSNGFFFASLLPGPQQDLLRLQYLSHLDFDPEEVVTTSDWGEQLKQFVLEDHLRWAGQRL